ncbi:hypothetical protein G6F57_016247 [Rhizopus arrhizus]|nr:hypothetical protein G6F57_016247 [Rhizopus arrhizus]
MVAITKVTHRLLAQLGVTQEELQAHVGQHGRHRHHHQLVGRVGDVADFDVAQPVDDFAGTVGLRAPQQALDVFQNQEAAEGDQQLEDGVVVLGPADQHEFHDAAQRQADSDGRHEPGGEQQDGGVGLGRQEHDEACRGIAAESIEGAVGDVQDAHHTEHQG